MQMPSSASSASDAAAAATAAELAIDEFTTSSLRTQAEVDALCRRHGVVLSRGFTVSPAEEDRNVSSPPPAGAVCVHVYALEAGLCCEPRQRFINAVLCHFGIAPTQLAPNSWRTMAGFVGLCHELDVEPSVAVFRHFFRLWPLQYRGESRYFFRNKIKNRAVFWNMPPPSATWKKSFFLVWSPVPWACPVVWGKPCESSLADRELTQFTKDERSAHRELSDAVNRYAPLDVNHFFHLYDDNDHGSASSSSSDMTPPAHSPRTNARETDPDADAMVNTTQAEKGTPVVQQSSSADHSPGKKRNREEPPTEGPLRLDLRRVSPPDFSAPNVNAGDREAMSMAPPDIQHENVMERVRELLNAATEADTLRKELKKTKAQLCEANEAAKLEMENADALREELKMMKAQLSEAKEATRLERENAGALRDELEEVKAEAKVALKEAMMEVMDKCSEITSRSNL